MRTFSKLYEKIIAITLIIVLLTGSISPYAYAADMTDSIYDMAEQDAEIPADMDETVQGSAYLDPEGNTGDYVIEPAADLQDDEITADETEAPFPSGGITDSDTIQSEDGLIHLDNFKQLQLIGTDTIVTDTDTDEDAIGNGRTIVTDEGTPLTYSGNADYYIDNDIDFANEEVWKLDDSFTGSFSGPFDVDMNRLYDEETDTIYIQNYYQLAVLSAADREDSPVMTGDAESESFGMGQFIYPDGEEDGNMLTYSERHHYVLSAAFSADHSERPYRFAGLRLRHEGHAAAATMSTGATISVRHPSVSAARHISL